MWFWSKTNSQRTGSRKNGSRSDISAINHLFNPDVVRFAFIWLGFVFLCTFVLTFELFEDGKYARLVPRSVIIALLSLAAAVYIYNYQARMIASIIRVAALAVLFLLLLTAAKISAMVNDYNHWLTATAVTAAIILSLAYDRRFALGMSVFYCLYATLAVPGEPQLSLFLIMVSGALTCCFSLNEIRTRMKLLEVGALAAVVVFTMVLSVEFIYFKNSPARVFSQAGYHSAATFLMGVLIQSLLPLIERVFHIATGMTLLDYSDANQPLLRRLALEAPGTFSHSLLIGSVAEAAAESIGRNGLLCRVGAYYHDIGKINKPTYFIENQMGLSSRHKELSPAMSQLVIVSHVKDGLELAKEYHLPVVLWQFIETHHGTTLVEYFYNEAKKHYDRGPLLESEFRYPGPKPRTKEAAIVMLADAVEGAVRAQNEASPTKIESIVYEITMKRLQDGQFDDCDLSLRELNLIEASIAKTLAAHYHGRIAYPKVDQEQ